MTMTIDKRLCECNDRLLGWNVKHNEISSGYLHFTNSHVFIVHLTIGFGFFAFMTLGTAAAVKDHEIVVYTMQNSLKALSKNSSKVDFFSVVKCEWFIAVQWSDSTSISF